LTSKPYNSKTVNIISFYNEVAVSLYLYVALLFSDFLESQIGDDKPINSLRLISGWILTSLLILTIFVNLVFAFVNIAIDVFKYFKNKSK
jgi:hypothetical protein